MRYPAAEQLEIIRLVEQSPLPARHTLAKLGIPPATFYRCYLTVPPSILVWLRRACRYGGRVRRRWASTDPNLKSGSRAAS
jgi:hypothetical protein